LQGGRGEVGGRTHVILLRAEKCRLCVEDLKDEQCGTYCATLALNSIVRRLHSRRRAGMAKSPDASTVAWDRERCYELASSEQM
jgi:hypothetical protein